MPRRAAWWTMTVLALLIALYAISAAVFPGARGPFQVDLYSRGALRAFTHMALGGIALAFGAFQFSNRLRIRKPRTHRRMGTVYVVTAGLGGLAALFMAPFSEGGLTAHFGFGFLAVLWLGTTGTAYLRVRAGDYASHREWMIRSYALCLAAVTLRVYLPLSGAVGIPFEEAYPVIAWLCWVPNIVVAEWFFVRGGFAALEEAA